jgi:biopolymer transport protein ExbD
MRPSTALAYENLTCLRRRFLRKARVDRGLALGIPLLNLVLLLFFFHLVNTASVLQPGVTVQLPVAEFVSGAPPGAMMLAVTRNGMLFFNDERTTPEKLGTTLSQLAQEKPDLALIIEADERVPNGVLVNLYNQARTAGLKRVTLGTRNAPVKSGGAP